MRWWVGGTCVTNQPTCLEGVMHVDLVGVEVEVLLEQGVHLDQLPNSGHHLSLRGSG